MEGALAVLEGCVIGCGINNITLKIFFKIRKKNLVHILYLRFCIFQLIHKIEKELASTSILYLDLPRKSEF